MAPVIITLVVLANLARVGTAAPLEHDYILSQKAHVRAEQLCKTGQWSHEGWVKSFSGTKYNYLGENLAKNFPRLEDAHAGFMNSSSHRANILNQNFQKMGVGFASCGMYVELFGGVGAK